LVEELTEGATNSPVLEIVPALAFQTTAVLLVEVSVAKNCCRSPEETIGLEGEMLSLMLELFETGCPGTDDDMVEQPFNVQTTAERIRAVPNRWRRLTNG